MLKPLIPQINWNNQITKGLIFDMPLFERGGTIAKDIVNLVQGTITGTTWKTNISGAILSFPGGANTDNILFTSTITPTTLRSIEMLFYINATDATSRRVYSCENSSNGTSLVDQVLVDTTNLFQFQVGWSTTTGNWKITTPSIGMWHQLVVTYDGSSVSNAPTIYVDGTSQTVTQVTAPIGSLNTTAEPMQIGNRFDNTRCFNGNIAYVRRWSRLLNTQEPKSLYTNPFQIYVRPPYQGFNSISAATYNALRSMMGMGT